MIDKAPHGTPLLSAKEISKIVFDARPSTIFNRSTLVEQLHKIHPRTRFIKSLTNNAVVLDLGAGDGMLPVLKSWPDPKREDIHIYAYSLEKGKGFDAYDGYELSDWEISKPNFNGKKFDAIFSSHFIEHISDFRDVLDWCASRLNPGGRLYLEWRSEYARVSPTFQELHTNRVMVQIGNFFDDKTHRFLPQRDEVIKHLVGNGLIPVIVDEISFRELENDLFFAFRDSPMSYELQSAYWSLTRWAQYVVSARAECR